MKRHVVIPAAISATAVGVVQESADLLVLCVIVSSRPIGNGKCRAYFKTHGVQDMKNKYNSLAAKQYRAQLDKLCKGEPVSATSDWSAIPEDKPG